MRTRKTKTAENVEMETNEQVEAAAALHLARSRAKRVVFFVFVIMLGIAFICLQVYTSSQTVQIVKMNTHKGLGDIVQLSDFAIKEISVSEYEAGTTQQITNDAGNKEVVKASYVLWSDRSVYENQFYNYLVNAGQELLTTTTSTDLQFKNPLIESMETGREIYQLPISADDVYLQMLYPQTTLRLRVAFEVPSYLVEDVQKAIDKKTIYDGSSVVQDVLINAGYSMSGTDITDDVFASIMPTTDDRMVMMSEVIFEELVAVDMISASGESIYELYLALLNMPIEERVPYLTLSFSNDVSGEFRQRVTPVALVFDLSKSEAAKMFEYELNEYDIKYTIVKTENTTDMLQGFVEINQMLVDQLKQNSGS